MSVHDLAIEIEARFPIGEQSLLPYQMIELPPTSGVDILPARHRFAFRPADLRLADPKKTAWPALGHFTGFPNGKHVVRQFADFRHQFWVRAQRTEGSYRRHRLNIAQRNRENDDHATVYRQTIIFEEKT